MNSSVTHTPWCRFRLLRLKSPDGLRIAYVPNPKWQEAWKRYRGGQTTPIWLADLKDSHIEKVPRDNSNDFNPMWVGGTVYFLSDRNGAVSLFAYDAKSKQPMWHASVEQSLYRLTGADAEKKIEAAVAAIFTKYPH